MSDMHQSMSIERLCRELPKLHGQVIRNWGRIQITAGNGNSNGNDGDACVLMSRAELECLERALELFCESPQGKEICEEIGRVAGVANRSMPRALGSAASAAAVAGVMAMTNGEDSSSSSFPGERPAM